MDRRLAAILATDVVGYSRLMEKDEVGTLAALKARRKDLLEPLVARHKGRIFKVTGDGVLMEFASAVNAVQCAVDFQAAMTAANEGQPEDRRIVVRVGIHLGDVMVEGSDLYGDGVNIAARPEAIAEPDGICVSEDAFRQVRNKLDCAFDDLGPQKLKNIAEPVRAYRVTAPRPTIGPALTLSDKPSIAVLAFTNMSGDPEQEYFSDGITEDIITDLSRWQSLAVASRNSTFRFKGTPIDIQRVGRELGVRFMVEGSVRRVGERVRVTAQLIDTETGNHLWAERFDRPIADIFAVQDEVVRTIVGTLVGRVHASGAEQARRKPPSSLVAYDYVLRGNALPWDDPASAAEAKRAFERAIEIDPDYGFAYSLLATMLEHEWANDFSGSQEALDRAFALARRAVELSENESTCHTILGGIYHDLGSFDLALHHMERGVEINPANQWNQADLGGLLNYMGRAEEGLEILRKARRMDSYFGPPWYWRSLGLGQFVLRRYADALTDFDRVTTQNQCWAVAMMAGCCAKLGLSDRTRKLVARCVADWPGVTVEKLLGKVPFKQAGDSDHFAECLRLAGLPE